MPLTRREKAGAASIGTGGALVYAGAQLNDRGINNGLTLAGKERKALPGLRAWRATKDLPGRGVPRAQMIGGNALKLIGTAGALGGAAQMKQGRDWRRKNPNNVILNKGLVKEGLKGNLASVEERAENLTEKKPVGALAIATGTALGASSLGSLATHRKLDKTKRNQRLVAQGKALKNRPGLVAMGGLAGLGLSAPISSKIVERKYPEYKVTAAGVTRKKKAPVRPSSQAAIFNQKDMGRSAFRSATVPSDVRKSQYLTDKQKRATILAAGAVPVVGDFAAAAAAGKVANPENRKKAIATQATGNIGGSLVGGAAGALGAAELARRSPALNSSMAGLNNKIGEKKKAILKPVTDRLPMRADKPSAPGAAASTWSKIKSAPGRAIPGALKNRYSGVAGGAIALGALGGNVIGGQTGGYKATTINLNRDRRTVAKALVIVNQGQKVDRQANDLAARRKKRSARLSTVGGTLGVGGFGMMVAAKRPSIAAKYPKLADNARDVGLVGGGVGGANALYFARVQRKEADALRAQRSTPSTKQTFSKTSPLRYAYALGVHGGKGTRGEVVRSLVKGPPKNLDNLDTRPYHVREAAGEVVPRRYRTKPEKKPRGRLVPSFGQPAVAKGMPNGVDLSVARGLGVLKRPTYRDSTLVRRQTRSGTLQVTRRKASVG